MFSIGHLWYCASRMHFCVIGRLPLARKSVLYSDWHLAFATSDKLAMLCIWLLFYIPLLSVRSFVLLHISCLNLTVFKSAARVILHRFSWYNHNTKISTYSVWLNCVLWFCAFNRDCFLLVMLPSILTVLIIASHWYPLCSCMLFYRGSRKSSRTYGKQWDYRCRAELLHQSRTLTQSLGLASQCSF